MLRSRFLWTAVVAVATALVAPATSEAAFTLTLTSGVNTRTYSSAPVGSELAFDSTSSIGGIDFYNVNSTMFAGYLFSFQGQTNNNSPAMGTGTLTNSTITTSGGGTAPLVATTTSSPYIAPGAGLVTLGTMLTASMLSPTGSLSATSTVTPGGSTTAATLTAAGANSTNSVITLTGPYTLSNTVTISGLESALEQTSFTLTSTVAAPAPTGLVMLAGALPFAGLLRLRRRGQPVTPATAA